MVAVPHRHLLELLPVVGATSLGGLALGEVGGEVIRVRVLDLGGPGSSGRCSSCRGSSGGRHVRGHGGSAGAARQDGAGPAGIGVGQDAAEDNCTICLEDIANKAMVDKCFHVFCYDCISQWADVTTTCPLCKRPFDSIIYNIVSDQHFDQKRFPTKTASGTDRTP